MLTDKSYEKDTSIKIDFDMKKLEFVNGDEIIIKPFDSSNTISLKFEKIKHKKEVEIISKDKRIMKNKNVIDFYLHLLGKEIESPERISKAILSALGTKAFNLNYNATIDAYDFKEDQNGFKATVLDEILYDNERFVIADVMGEKIKVRTDNLDKELYLTFDLDKIGITETSIDIKLI